MSSRRGWWMVGIGVLLLTLLLALTEQMWGLFVVTAIVLATSARRTRDYSRPRA